VEGSPDRWLVRGAPAAYVEQSLAAGITLPGRAGVELGAALLAQESLASAALNEVRAGGVDLSAVLLGAVPLSASWRLTLTAGLERAPGAAAPAAWGLAGVEVVVLRPTDAAAATAGSGAPESGPCLCPDHVSSHHGSLERPTAHRTGEGR
jgi:hypothetical protein